VGDFDSITAEEKDQISLQSDLVIAYDARKNKTDTELAIDEALKLGATEIVLLGATGRRIDHFLGTLNIYHQFVNLETKLVILDEYNQITLLKPGKTEIKKTKYQYISFFSYLNAVEDLTLTGFKYELDKHYLDNQDSLCISNEVLKLGTIEFSKGLLLVVESND
jgi:thiamine pyrophosphokinase